jgi:hypothetical protein
MEASASKKVVRVGLSVNPQGGGKQDFETVQRIVKFMLGRGGCDGCGRLAYLDLHFHGDPGPDITKLGGISLEIQER